SSDAKIEYVGHPLLDEITIRKTDLTSSGKITFMPGSRPGEIKRLMPVFQQLRPMIDATALLVIPPQFTPEQIDEFYGDISSFELTHDAHQSLAESDFAFICSGTATLEACLIGTPFILTYIAKSLDYTIASRLVKLDYVGLGNILFSHVHHRSLHPEFIQNEVNAQNLYNAYQKMDKNAFFNDTKTLRELLAHGSARRVSTIIKEYNV
ncbi:MAG: lipid-A-disaccharide synthase, partial [Sulfuricurvum sp.]